MKRVSLLLGSLAVVGSLLAAQGYAQEQGQQAKQSQAKKEAQVAAGERIRLPAEQSMVEVHVEYPDKVRVGESFQYKIHVKNITDKILLNNVTIRQQVPQGFDIESSSPPMSKEQQEGDQQQKEGQQGQEKQQAKDQQDGQEKQQAKDQQAKDQQDGQEKQQDQGRTVEWVVKDLKPGETKTIEVKATSDKEGSVRTCLAISYTPALCLTTQFVKPEIELTKAVPDEASVCQLLAFVYRVRNTGSGETRPLMLRDELPEGLKTRDGKDMVEIPIDPLAPGDSKEVETLIVATKTGDLGSRAVIVPRDQKEKPEAKDQQPEAKDEKPEAKDEKSQPKDDGKEDDGKEEVLARSERVTTNVRRPELNVQIDGPQAQPVDEPFTYTITVTNKGEVVARNGELRFQYDGNKARLVEATEPQRVEREKAKAEAKQDAEKEGAKKQPTDAPQDKQEARETQEKEEAQSQAKEEAKQEKKERQEETKTWDLGNLEPGQTVRVRVTMIGTEQGSITPQAVANFDCPAAKDQIETRTRARAQTEILAFPALLITVLDQPDPIEVGKEVTYEIVVRNQGSAADRNVQVKVEMPEELTFVEGSGTTKVEGQDGGVRIAPLDQLAAGDEARWKVLARGDSAGDVRFRIEVTSDYLTRPAVAEEPTRVFSTEKAAQEKPEAKAKPAGEAKETPEGKQEKPEGQE